MSYVPHTDGDVATMLAEVRLGSVDELFASIPSDLRIEELPPGIPNALTEPELMAEFERLASMNRSDLLCFAGGGAYDSFLPAAVTALGAKPEFATAYTPYQPEVSQGVLQAIFEFQSLICALTGMEVANASLYDGASALVEAANLAVSVTGRAKVIVSRGVNPRSREVLATFAGGTGCELVEAELDNGLSSIAEVGDDIAAVVIGHPNYLGTIEDVRAVSELTSAAGALLVVVTDPLANGILARPGDLGADVVVGEGQSLGNALNFGGPYLGLFATRMQYLRALPGRISGETIDADGKRSYALALQGREQHIRREKASSNICTNQTLMAVTAAVALSWLGPVGLKKTAESAILKSHYLADRLSEIPGCSLAVSSSFFREFVLRVPNRSSGVLEDLLDQGILGGIDLAVDYPELGDAILVAVTERRTRQDLDNYVEAMQKVVA